MATKAIGGHMTGNHEAAHANEGMGHYSKFAIMIGVSFIAMYFFMFAMISSSANFYHNINMVYMAGLMAAPMAIIEILLMSKMYPNKKTNAAIIIGSVLLLGICWGAIRNQVGVGDKEFVRSMIPHHSGAILMCNESKIQDAELKDLCANIVKSQDDEIEKMKGIYARLNAQ